MNKTALPIIVKESLCLEVSTKIHLSQLKSWFNDSQQVLEWAGPSFVFPASETSFIQQLSAPIFTSFSLTHNDDLVGFGQYQLHPPFLHLGRLAIKPIYRGNGLGHALLKALIDEGIKNDTIKTISLFVYNNNQIAYKVYKKAGFTKSVYPLGKQKIKDCDYLVLNLK